MKRLYAQRVRIEATAEWGESRELTGSVRSLTLAGPTTADPALPSVRTRVVAPVQLTNTGFTGDVIDAPHGPDEVVSAYPWEHYAHWADTMKVPLPDAAFGENATTVGLLESTVFVGDTFEWGTATVQVSGPRRPDPHLGIHLGIPDLDRRMAKSRRTGFSFRVLRTGKIGPADQLRLIDVDPVGLSVADLTTALSDGPAAAALSIERLLLTRHVLADHWLNLLSRLHPAHSASE